MNTVLIPNEVLFDYNYPPEIWCDNCVDNIAIHCNHCKKLFDKNEIETVKVYHCDSDRDEEDNDDDNDLPNSPHDNEEPDILCHKCEKDLDVKRCFVCGKFFYNESIMEVTGRIDNSIGVCNCCFNQGSDNGDLCTCDSCGKVTYCDDMSNNGRGSYCLNCTPQDIILGSGANPLDEEYGLKYDREISTGTTKPYMGVELEVTGGRGYYEEDFSYDANESIREENRWGLLKEDGSVHNGFEICTVPMLIDEHYRIWKEDFEERDFHSRMSQHGSRCGMHIHLNKPSVTKIGLGRLIFLVYGQQSNVRFTKLIAERSPNTYWKTHPQNIKDITNHSYRVDRYKRRSYDKFEAINLDHDDSIEFRMFRSDTSSDAIFKGLEYVAACREFCNNEIFIRPHWYNFVDWVFKNKTTYPHLTAFLEAKKEEGYFDELSMRIRAEQEYLNVLFKKAAKDIIYYEEDDDGSRILCSMDGNNWWKEIRNGKTVPICGEVPSRDYLLNAKKLPLESLITN
jgi:hypothetical protein